MHRELQLRRALDERLHAAADRAVVGIRADDRRHLVALLHQILGRHPAVLLVVGLDVVAGERGRAPRHEPHVRQGAQLREALGHGFHALDDEPVELFRGQRRRQLVGCIRKQDTQIDPVPCIRRLDLQQLVLKPVQAGVVRLGADEPDADPALFRETGLGSAAPAQRRGHVIVLLHHGPDPRQAVRRDNLRLVDRARHGRGRHLRFLRDLGDQHGAGVRTEIFSKPNEMSAVRSSAIHSVAQDQLRGDFCNVAGASCSRVPERRTVPLGGQDARAILAGRQTQRRSARRQAPSSSRRSRTTSGQACGSVLTW